MGPRHLLLLKIRFLYDSGLNCCSGTVSSNLRLPCTTARPPGTLQLSVASFLESFLSTQKPQAFVLATPLVMAALCCCGPRRTKPQSNGHGCLPQRDQPVLIPPVTNSETHVQTEKEPSLGAQAKANPHTTPPQIHELVGKDDDSDGGGHQHQPDLTRRASAALGAVRTRIIRHLSSESDVKRQSTASVGKSQEEIARRAELKRLRHKRIQAELDNDINRELKKDCSTKSPVDQPRNASIKSVRHGSLTSPSQSQPGGGPRDTIEFTVPDANRIPSRSHSPAHSLASREPSHQEHQVSRQTSATCLPLDQADGNTQEEHTNRPSTRREPQSSDPTKTSQAIPISETRSTFRLSSSPSWLDRIIGVDNTFTDNGENPSLDGRSALSIWLAAQGLRSRDNSMANLEPDDGQAHVTKGSKGFDDLSITASELSHGDGHGDDPQSQPPRKASPIRSTSRNFIKEPKHGLAPEPTSTTDEGPIHKSPSEDLALDYAAALAFTSPNDNASSQYASQAQSLQPSPSRSRANLHRLHTHELKDMQLSPFQWHKNVAQRKAERSEAQSSYVTAQDHVSVCDMPMLPPHSKDPATGQDVTDATSPAHSETASFQIREAELQTIEKRFADVLSRRKPITYTSRFVEDFSEPPQTFKKKPSLIPRIIHLHTPGKFKYASKKKGIVQIQGPSTQALPDTGTANRVDQASTQQKGCSPDRSPSLAASLDGSSARPGLKESATDLWQRALRQEAEQRKGTSSKSAISGQSSPSRSKNSLRQKTPAETPNQTHTTACAKYLEVPGATRTPSQPKLRLAPWATSINKKASIREVWPKLPMDLAEAPESWAKFPTYNREERNAHAKSEDNVESQDFAVGTVTSEGEMLGITDKDSSLNKNIENRRSSSTHGRLGKMVKSSITKMFPFTENLSHSRSNSLGRRRGSFQLAGEVEYPELEVLPPGIGHILEPEQVAEKMLFRKRSFTTSSRRSFGVPSVKKALEHRASASSLTQRRRRSSRSMPSADPLVCRSIEVLPKTPLRVWGCGDKNSTPRTEVFVTPLSTNLAGEDIESKEARHVQLPPAKSENVLPLYKLHSQEGESTGCTRSVTWSGSLSSAQPPRAGLPQHVQEHQVYSRPQHLNASKDSFGTGASFKTATGE